MLQLKKALERELIFHNIALIKEVVDKDDLMIITNQGVLIRLPVAQIRSIGRATKGVKLIKLGEGTLVSSITRIMSEEEEDENNNTEPADPKE